MEENSTFDNTVLFDTYLRGAMTPEEKAVFEARLESEPDLREQLEFHRQVMEGLANRAENMALKRQIGSIRQKMREKEHGSNTFLKFFVTATLLLLFVAAGVWYLWLRPVSLPVFPVQGTPKPTVPRQDSLKPAAIKDTLPPPVAKNNHIEKEESGPKMGAQKVDTLNIKSPVTRLVVKEGKVERTVDVDMFNVILYKNKSTRLEGGRTGTRVQLYVPAHQFYSSKNWHLFELVSGNERKLYLQIDKDFYLIKEGQDYLVKEPDEGVVKWLRQ